MNEKYWLPSPWLHFGDVKCQDKQERKVKAEYIT